MGEARRPAFFSETAKNSNDETVRTGERKHGVTTHFIGGNINNNFVIWAGSIAANRVGTSLEVPLAHKPQEHLTRVGNIDALVPHVSKVSRDVFEDAKGELFVRTKTLRLGHQPSYSWSDVGAVTPKVVPHAE